MTTHTSDIFEDEDGWIIARCTCGWQFGAVPDNETATDVLMDHVAERAATARPVSGDTDR